MSRTNQLDAGFEASRPRLRALAYRMLGSAAEAEDAVQETWLRLQQADTTGIANLEGWLTTVAARICLDALRLRKSRREEPLEEEVPERGQGMDPAEELMLARSVGLALLVVLEALSPAERVAFVLHDLFDLSFAEVAPIVGRSQDATRQMVSRARRRVRGAEVRASEDVAKQCELIEAFLAASRDGDTEKLLALLDPDVMFRADSAAMRGAPAREVRGASAVAKLYAGRAQGAGAALIDGAPGIVVTPRGGQLMLVIRVSFDRDTISGLDVIGDPAKLRAMEIVAPK